jgi:gamma-glutamyltranspeptidase
LFSEKKECVAIDAREAAPSSAHQRMFVDGNPPPSSVSGMISEEENDIERIFFN